VEGGFHFRGSSGLPNNDTGRKNNGCEFFIIFFFEFLESLVNITLIEFKNKVVS
jgi:hypothetical protein